MTIRCVPILILVLAGVAAPLSATIQYSYCNSGCADNTGTGSYAAWQSAPGSAGLSFSMSPINFAAGVDVNGVFTDTSGATFTGYNGASPDALFISGTSLAQTIAGTGTGIQIVLPANTFAIAFSITTVSGFGSPVVELNDRILNNANYQIVIPNGSTTAFFGIISDVALTSLFVGNNGAGGAVKLGDFELGQGAAEAETPELSSLALLGTGLLLFGLIRRRRVQEPSGSLA